MVLPHESDESLCSWLPLARQLTALGYRVVVWDYGGNEPPGGTARTGPVGAQARGGTLALMGASEGAKTSLVAAALLGHAVNGVVSLRRALR